MIVVVLCGGKGTRLSEETLVKPKPMVEIGGFPILWHIMKTYSHFGFKEFMLALGYKGEIIKEYFINYHARISDITVNTANGQMDFLNQQTDDWKVHLINTGQESMTGGRILRLAPYLRERGPFMLTYGDGVAKIDVAKLLRFHQSHGKLATLTAARPSARFGDLELKEDQVLRFKEKPQAGGGWINGGFFVFEPQVFDYLEDDRTILEREPLENLARDGQLRAYLHHDYWQCMDTVRDRDMLEELWQGGQAPWAVWKGE